MGAYVALTAVAILGMVLMHFVKFPPVVEKVKGSSEGRPLSEIMKQPVFIVSAAAAAGWFDFSACAVRGSLRVRYAAAALRLGEILKTVTNFEIGPVLMPILGPM
jgi:hypothetical protein